MQSRWSQGSYPLVEQQPESRIGPSFLNREAKRFEVSGTGFLPSRLAGGRYLLTVTRIGLEFPSPASSRAGRLAALVMSAKKWPGGQWRGPVSKELNQSTPDPVPESPLRVAIGLYRCPVAWSSRNLRAGESVVSRHGKSNPRGPQYLFDSELVDW